MKKNILSAYVVDIVLFIFIILYAFVSFNFVQFTKYFVLLIFLTFLMPICLLYFGVKKDKNYFKGTAIRTMISIIMGFILIIYNLGLFLGFNKAYFPFGMDTFMASFLPILLISIETEVVRYCLVKNIYDNKKPLILFTILISIINCLCAFNMNLLGNPEKLFAFFSTNICTIVACEALCSYLTYKIGFSSSLIYKIYSRLFLYFVPIYPALGDYIYSVVNVLLPFIIYMVINKNLLRYEKDKKSNIKVNHWFVTIPLVITFIVLTILISGIFKYKLIAVSSNSMLPTFARGDAIIYEKYNYKNFKVGDVMAFARDGMIITHRIAQIEIKGDKYFFYTKGDNNNDVDATIIKPDNILGKVDSVIKYIGYPTVWMNEYFGKLR